MSNLIDLTGKDSLIIDETGWFLDFTTFELLGGEENENGTVKFIYEGNIYTAEENKDIGGGRDYMPLRIINEEKIFTKE